MRRHTMIGMVLLGSLFVAGCSSSATSTATTATTGASGGSATSSTVADSVLGTVKWVASNHGVVTALASDVSALATSLPAAVSAKSTTGVTADCQKLATDLTSAMALPPIPNATAQKQWTSVLSGLATASQQCSDGVAKNDSSVLSQAATSISGSSGALSTLSHTLGI